MNRIFKYPLKIEDRQTLYIPGPAKILYVQPQGNTPCLWAEVDDELEKEQVHIAIFGTGHPIPEIKKKYINTFQTDEGRLVWHVYQIWE